MALKSILLAAAALIVLNGSSFAADSATTQHTAAGIAAAKVGTEAEKAVGAGDTITNNDLKAQVPLTKVSDPVNTLATAKVDDPMGHIIGPVKSVITSAKGTTQAINVDVGGWLGVGERVVSMRANDFTYLPDRNILLTKMSKDQVKKLPPVKTNG